MICTEAPGFPPPVLGAIETIGDEPKASLISVSIRHSDADFLRTIGFSCKKKAWILRIYELVMDTSALWNCLSLSDKFTIKRRGGAASLSVIHIQTMTRSDNFRSVHP